MQDFMCSNAADMHNERLAEKTRYLKETPKGESEMCKAIEEMKKEVADQIAVNMLEDGKLTFEKISEYSGLTLEEVTELAKYYNLMPV